MKQNRMKIVGVVLSCMVLTGVGYTSIQYLNANAAQSPYDSLPPEKRAIEEKQERNVNAARAQNVPKPKGNPGPSVKQEDTPLKTEIIDFVDDPMRNKVILFTNGWIAPTQNGEAVSVSAGSLVNDKQQGVVLVRHYNSERFMDKGNIINSPEKSGSLTIKDYKGNILTLSTEDGKELKFNVSSEKFE